MTDAASLGWILLLALATPLALLAAGLWRGLRQAVAAALVVAPLPGLAAALLALVSPPLAFDFPPLRISLALDPAGAILLGVSALLWSTGGIYALAFLRRTDFSQRFVACWLLTLAGSIGVFIAADLVGFYLVFALVSLPAYGLIVHDEDAAACRAGSVYMAFTVLGEALLLMGFVLLAAGEPMGSQRIDDVVAALPHSPWRDSALVLTAAGFLLKVGLAPMHGWMPLTYAAAPFPAAAVLSGAGVNAGVIGLIRFLPFDNAMPLAGELLAAIGLSSAFYGVAIGITQSNPRTVLAYSSVSQMGVIAAVLGMGLAAGDASAALAGAFYAAHHLLAKGALFMAVGVTAVTMPDRTKPTLLLAAVLALGLGGLPLTGGALAKLVVKSPLGDGLVGTLASLSAAATTLLMLHFLARLARSAAQQPQPWPSPGFVWPWRLTALASILVPWLVYHAGGGDLAESLAPAALFDAVWPMAIGAVLSLALLRWGDRLPDVAAGDIVGAAEKAFRASYSIGAVFEGIDGRLRQWPAAGLSLVAVAVMLGAATVFGR